MPATEWAGSDFQEPPRSDGGVALCGACSARGICRLGLTTEVLGADDVARFDIVCPPEHEGARGSRTAGGRPPSSTRSSATCRSSTAPCRSRSDSRWAISGRCPSGARSPASAWIERKESGYWHIAGELTLASTLAPLARARGVWALRDRTHFARYEAWLAEQDAAAADG